jgi:(S)-ureidoglycine aminohydrolase
MATLLGHTRTRNGARHAVLSSDSHTPHAAAGLEKGRVATLISPRLGASFLVTILAFDTEDGKAAFPENDTETFVYVLEGACTADAGPAQVKRLSAGGYLFVPARQNCNLSSPDAGTRLLIFKKKFQEAPLTATGAPSLPPPRMIVGRSGQVQPQPYQGDPDTRIQSLLPDEPNFDIAVCLFTFQPGASLPQVTQAAGDHGYLFLQVQGILRLEESWYPVREGDAAWTGAHCPQWFVATGKTPAQFLFIREANRFPSAEE